jgi:tryptophan synthase alpha chain
MSARLRRQFAAARARGKALFLPYVCVGYPSYEASLKTAEAALRAGASALELGMPFSDPIADGPTLQAATHQALLRGAKFSHLFRLMRDLRKKGFRQPLLAMTYLNPVEKLGVARFAEELARAGGDGAILPDLPLEEFKGYAGLLRAKGLCLVPFLAPTSDAARVKLADAQGAPFLYYVSLTGVTGARRDLPQGLLRDLKALRKKVATQVVVGFGISTPAQAAQVGRVADGVIIASALINLISRTRAARIGKVVEGFCRKVVKALGK